MSRGICAASHPYKTNGGQDVETVKSRMLAKGISEMMQGLRLCLLVFVFFFLFLISIILSVD